jgi:hypothetical protein
MVQFRPQQPLLVSLSWLPVGVWPKLVQQLRRL